MKKYILSFLLFISVSLCFGEDTDIESCFLFEPRTSMDAVIAELQNDVIHDIKYNISDNYILIQRNVSESDKYSLFNISLRFTDYFLSGQITQVRVKKEFQNTEFLMNTINYDINKYNLYLVNMYTVKAHPCISLKSPTSPNYLVAYEYNQANWEIWKSIYDLELTYK